MTFQLSMMSSFRHRNQLPDGGYITHYTIKRFTLSNFVTLISIMADELERPFLVRDIEIGGITLPVSPITILILFISAQILLRALFKSSTVTASHILLEGSSEETRKKLEQYKREINNDATKFAEYAGKYSSCPSGKNGSPKGSLGKFAQGAMVPPFDKAVFSPKNKVGDVVGPIQTQFGWHLILIHERDEQRSLVPE